MIWYDISIQTDDVTISRYRLAGVTISIVFTESFYTDNAVPVRTLYVESIITIQAMFCCNPLASKLHSYTKPAA